MSDRLIPYGKEHLVDNTKYIGMDVHKEASIREKIAEIKNIKPQHDHLGGVQFA